MVEVSYLNNLKVSIVFSETCLKPAGLFKCPSGDIPLSDSGVGKSVGGGSSRKRLAAAMVRSYVTPLGKPRGCRRLQGFQMGLQAWKSDGNFPEGLWGAGNAEGINAGTFSHVLNCHLEPIIGLRYWRRWPEIGAQLCSLHTRKTLQGHCSFLRFINPVLRV